MLTFGPHQPMRAAGGSSGRQPRWLWAAAASVMLFAVTGCQTIGPEIPDPAGSFGFPPQPDRRFIRLGATAPYGGRGRQFTEEEFRFLSDNFDYVLFTKFHAGWNIALHHEAAHRLTELKPALRVFPYFSTKYRFRQNGIKQNNWEGRPFDPAWNLRDNQGNVIYRPPRQDRDDPKGVTYVDLANPGYRQWAIEVLRSWLEAAPYAGISFDSAVPIGVGGEEVAGWERLLGRDRIEEYNAGMRMLLASAKQLVGPDREVIYNGIAPTSARGPDRNLGLLEVTDGALDERFCITSHGQFNPIETDLELMERYSDRQLFLRTGYDHRLPDNERDRYGRYCLGGFLMGWRPGLTYFQFGNGYTADQLGTDIPDMNLPIGPPVGPYRRDGDALGRPFANGEVYVNVSDGPAQVTLSRPLTKVQAGEEPAPLEAGAAVVVPPRDAVFLLESDAVGGLEQAPGKGQP